MTNLRQTAQQALEALQYASTGNRRPEIIGPAITALKAALEQQAEPVAVYQWREQGCADWYDGHPDYCDGGGPYETRMLYTTPPQRKWQGLTDEDWAKVADMPDTFDQGVAWAQARLKEKNDLHKD